MVSIQQPSFKRENPDVLCFTEVQRYRQTWIWVLLGALLGTLIFLGVFQVLQSQVSDTPWLPVPALLFIGGIWGGLVLLAYKAHLFVQINKQGIKFQLFPFQWATRNIAWADIDEMYIRDYDGLAEYGGWGMRYGPRGKAYTISGRFGMQLQLIDDQQILIGTQRPAELEELIVQLRYNQCFT
ncbi:hypothetical protein [Tunicatimonas pelagia]|uniref:hypothetical protein n=1 Tax=Tunicatimonas pelagia TaxID=931531 RepID=UPI0026670C6F|nr:hypothetical protein [Tunicatimonas pelagia]WKN45543.1 hypothetical protein P0M28_11305 [Tunicatimonas pelagia]